jgi:hypothetical protein
MLGY